METSHQCGILTKTRKGKLRTLSHDLPVHRRLRVNVEDGVARVAGLDQRARRMLDLVSKLAVGHGAVLGELEELPGFFLGRFLSSDCLQEELGQSLCKKENGQVERTLVTSLTSS